jgi:hypothetical protein
VKSLDGKWTGIVGGTNIGKTSVSLRQNGSAVSGEFVFQDLFVVPVRAQIVAALSGRILEGTLSGFAPVGAVPPGAVTPSGGRMLGIVEEDGHKITGFWMTNIGTAGGFVLVNEG